jgi:SAM-dependent methyltransferase
VNSRTAHVAMPSPTDSTTTRCSDSSIVAAYQGFLNTRRGATAFRRYRELVYGSPVNDTLVAALIPIIVANERIARAPTLRVCDIGGGDGARVALIVKTIEEKFKSTCHVDLVDPSEPLVDIAERSQGWRRGQLRIFNAKIEDVTLPGKYDLVLLLHSIYAQVPGHAVSRLPDLLRSGGVAVAVANLADGFVGQMKEVLDAPYADAKYEHGQFLEDLVRSGLPFERHSIRTRCALRVPADVDACLHWLSSGRYKELSNTHRLRLQRFLRARGHQLGARLLLEEHEEVLVVSPS